MAKAMAVSQGYFLLLEILISLKQLLSYLIPETVLRDHVHQ